MIWHFQILKLHSILQKTIIQIAINFSSFHAFIRLKFVALMFYSVYADMCSCKWTQITPQ